MTGHRWLRAIPWLGLPFAVAMAQAPGAGLQGTVIDSVRHGPLAGARVVVTRNVGPDSVGLTREFLAKTDATGHFAFPALAPAVYLVTVEHPWLDSTGLEVAAQTVDLRERRSAMVSLATPSGATIRSTFCRLSAGDTTSGLVEGVVRDARTDRPVAAAKILFEWNDFTADARTGRPNTRRHTFSVDSDTNGSFLVCGLPGDYPVLIQAQLGAMSSTGAIEVKVPSRGVLFETLLIAAGATGTAQLSGEVHRAGSGLPVAGAHVHVFGAKDEVITATDGSFNLTAVPIGTQSIEVTALGLRPQRYAVEVRQDEPGNVDIALAEMTRTLDTVRTIATHAAASARRIRRPGAAWPRPVYQ